MIACPRCDTPLDDDDRCPMCSAGPEREHDPLDAPEQSDPRPSRFRPVVPSPLAVDVTCRECFSRVTIGVGCPTVYADPSGPPFAAYVCVSCVDADQSAAWGDPRPMPEWRD